jgi:hypothetical protein
MRKAASTIPQEGTPMHSRALGAEVPTLSALAGPTPTTPVLFVGTTSRGQGIAGRGAEIGGHFGVSAGEAPPIVIGANGTAALMCGDAGVDGGLHVD